MKALKAVAEPDNIFIKLNHKISIELRRDAAVHSIINMQHIRSMHERFCDMQILPVRRNSRKDSGASIYDVINYQYL